MLDRVVAVVDKKPILLSDARMRARLKGTDKPVDLRENVEELIDEIILEEGAERRRASRSATTR